jgi:hypothetical protein
MPPVICYTPGTHPIKKRREGWSFQFSSLKFKASDLCVGAMFRDSCGCGEGPGLNRIDRDRGKSSHVSPTFRGDPVWIRKKTQNGNGVLLIWKSVINFFLTVKTQTRGYCCGNHHDFHPPNCDRVSRGHHRMNEPCRSTTKDMKLIDSRSLNKIV